MVSCGCAPPNHSTQNSDCLHQRNNIPSPGVAHVSIVPAVVNEPSRQTATGPRSCHRLDTKPTDRRGKVTPEVWGVFRSYSWRATVLPLCRGTPLPSSGSMNIATASGGGCVETVRLMVQRRDFNFVGDLRAELVGMPTCGASGGVSASWLP
jgi:hypothetical protein